MILQPDRPTPTVARVICGLMSGLWLIAGSSMPAIPAELKPSSNRCAALPRKASLMPRVPLEVQEMRRELEALEKAAQYEKAAQLSQRMLTIKTNLYGLNHPEVAAQSSNLAGIYLRQGRYAMAQPLYEQALTIDLCSLGDSHLDTAIAISNLAGLYERQGRYGIAEPLFEKVIRIFSSILGDNHRLIAAPLNNLGMLLYEQGRDLEAEPLLSKALAIREKELGPDHLLTATSLSNLALLQIRQRNYAEALSHLYRALAIREKQLGGEHPETAVSLNNLAFLYGRLNRFDEALGLFRRVLATRTGSLGQQHPLTANSLNNLAMLYWAQNRSNQAEPLFRQALAIRQTVLGPEHPDTIASLSNLALLQLQESQTADAEPLLIRLNRDQGEWLRRELPLQPRELRRKLLAEQPNAMNLSFALLDQAPGATYLALETRLNRQGLLAEIERRQRQLVTSSGKTRDLAEWIAGIDQQLASHGTTAEHRTRLQRERRRLEGELSRLLPDLRIKAVSVEQVAGALRALAPQGLLVEFQRYRPLQRRGSRTGEGLWGAARYMALLLHADGRIVRIPMGEAGPIDQAVGRALKASATSSSDVEEHWQRLGDLVLTPMMPELRNVRELFISPDGGLHRLPFAGLPTPWDRGNRLNQSYKLRLVTTGRDLIRLQQPGREGGSAVLIANPAYDALLRPLRSAIGGPSPSSVSGPRAPWIVQDPIPSMDPVSDRQQRSGELSLTVWSPLPGTDREARALAPLLQVARPITAQAATATLVLRQRGPRILHIATHGFFRPDQPAVSAQPLLGARSDAGSSTAQREDPLVRSGLVMAGANHPDADPTDDGYLTAAEVTGMDLNGTQLVTLSACASGLGELQPGEGVYGLQRALTVAGARSTLLSLWSVDDEGTKAFMEAFYSRLINGEGRAEALAQTQAAFRRHANPLFRNVYVWGAFQLSGDWRPIRPRSHHPSSGI
jgi:CHAT domain-containing protein/tetratricopeptide (TPR) repeat protein